MNLLRKISFYLQILMNDKLFENVRLHRFCLTTYEKHQTGVKIANIEHNMGRSVVRMMKIMEQLIKNFKHQILNLCHWIYWLNLCDPRGNVVKLHCVLRFCNVEYNLINFECISISLIIFVSFCLVNVILHIF